ncbi:MAG: transglycosylase domain-containing protein, partial [Bacteroidales bacterium]
GSTISMQIVKNLFLSKNKIISRKIEELCLVWLIENNQLIGKERLFEIYVNIIEWAPGIYGVKEAARFYFDKRPEQLTLPESVYLATLVRAPKHYANTVDESGRIRDFRQNEMRFLVQKMLEKGMISQTEYDTFDPGISIVLKGSQ